MSDKYLSKEEIVEIVEEHTLSKEEVVDAVSDGITQAFMQIGIAAEDASDVIEVQKDMAYIRRIRTGSDTLKSKAFLTVVGSAVTALLALVVAGAMQFFGGTSQ